MARSENIEQSDFRRQQILMTALEIISERGYSETRIADIAKRAGISSGLVMYYFPTKVDLLVGAVRYAEDGWYGELEDALADATTATELLEGMVAIFLIGGRTPMLQMQWSLWLDLWSQATRNETIAAVHRENDTRWREKLTTVIEQGIAAKEFVLFGTIENTVIALAAMFDGFAVNVACKEGNVTAEVAFNIAMRFSSLSLGFVWQNDDAVATRLQCYFEPEALLA